MRGFRVTYPHPSSPASDVRNQQRPCRRRAFIRFGTIPLADAAILLFAVAPAGPWVEVPVAASLASYGHYCRHVPFWKEANQVALVALIGPLLSLVLVLVACGNRPDHLPAWLSKATLDIVLAAVMLVLLVPVTAVLALLVRADGGPALYMRSRIGANGRRSGCPKFRTMVIDAAAALARLLASDPRAAAEWAASRTRVHDPRVAGIGWLLHRTSLDKLPRFINVRRGQISLVGQLVCEELRTASRYHHPRTVVRAVLSCGSAC